MHSVHYCTNSCEYCSEDQEIRNTTFPAKVETAVIQKNSHFRLSLTLPSSSSPHLAQPLPHNPLPPSPFLRSLGRFLHDEHPTRSLPRRSRDILAPAHDSLSNPARPSADPVTHASPAGDSAVRARRNRHRRVEGPLLHGEHGGPAQHHAHPSPHSTNRYYYLAPRPVAIPSSLRPRRNHQSEEMVRPHLPFPPSLRCPHIARAPRQRATPAVILARRLVAQPPR